MRSLVYLLRSVVQLRSTARVLGGGRHGRPRATACRGPRLHDDEQTRGGEVWWPPRELGRRAGLVPFGPLPGHRRARIRRAAGRGQARTRRGVTRGSSKIINKGVSELRL